MHTRNDDVRRSSIYDVHIRFAAFLILAFYGRFFFFFWPFQFPGVSGWLPTAAGLGLIPFIVAPLDNLVEEVRDKSSGRFAQAAALTRTVPIPSVSKSHYVLLVVDMDVGAETSRRVGVLLWARNLAR